MTPLMPASLTNRSVNAAGITTIPQGDGVSAFTYAGEFAWCVKELAVANGGVITGCSSRTSGTGTDANGTSTSDLWDGPYRTAYGLSWIAWTMPSVRGVVRNYCIQLSAYGASYDWRVKLSFGYANRFLGGSATVTPTATGEVVICGGGSNASPTFVNYQPNSGSFYVQGVRDTDLGGLVCAMYPVAGGAVGAQGAFFALDPFVANTYEVGDDDAATLVTEAKLPEIVADFTEASTTEMVRALAQKGLGGEALATFAAHARLVPGSVASSARTGEKPHALLGYSRNGAPTSPGGLSSMLKAYGPVGSVPRLVNIETYPGSGVRIPHMLLGDFCVPVPSGFTPS